VFFPERIFQRF